MYRVKFYRVEMSKEDERETRHYLGYLDVVDSKLPDGCNLTAKAFRLASAEQRNANAVDIQRL